MNFAFVSTMPGARNPRSDSFIARMPAARDTAEIGAGR